MSSFVASLRLTMQRAAGRPSLFVIRLIGVLLAVTQVVGITLYSTAMGDAMLQARLQTDPSGTGLAFSVNNGSLLGTRYAAFDAYVRSRAAADLGLPLQGLIVEHSTATVSLYRLLARSTQLAAHPLAEVALNYDEDLANHATVIAGQLDLAMPALGGTAGVVLLRETALSLGLQQGDRIAFSADGATPLHPILVVAGIVAPLAAGGEYWNVVNAEVGTRSLITSRLATFQAFASQSSNFSPDYFWVQHTEYHAVHLADASAIIDHLARVRSTTSALVPGTMLLTSLDLDLNGFLSQYDLLPFVLLILAGPIVALMLYAVVVATTLVLEQQANEILWMRSRGASRGQVFTIYTFEAVLFGAAALLIGPLLGLRLAMLISHASGFLVFGGGLPVQFHMTGQAYLLAAATALLCVIAGLLPALDFARRSLIAYKAERARGSRRPLWQRLYLDLVVLTGALYGLAVLNKQGPVTTGAATATVAQDPLIALAPVLFAVAITLLISRLLPWMAGALVGMLAGISSPAIHVALQSVARAPRQPMRLVQLCTMTLTLGIFAATVAGVEARNQLDQQAYEAGAMVRLQEAVNRTQGAGKGIPDAMPLADHLQLPGVRAVMPAMRYPSIGNITNTTSGGASIDVLGIDPHTASQVIWFRADFANLSLNRLLSLIVRPSPDTIVSETFLKATGLRQGDSFDVTLTNERTITLRVAGVVGYFPTLNPEAFPFVITNLEYLQRTSHGYGPNEMWLAVDPDSRRIDRLLEEVSAWPRQIVVYESMAATPDAGIEPLKVGIYGVVSVGFLSSVVLALLGFLTYAYISLQRRLVEFAVLRALGLSSNAMRSLLLYEQVFLLGAAMIGGIVAGVLTTRLFLPYLPIAVNSLPPFLVLTPWSAILAFVLVMLVLFVLVLSTYVGLVLRLRLGSVLRLGEG